MRLPRLLRTSSFRLAVLYAALFSASAMVLFAIIYWSTLVYMTGQLDAAIDSDFSELTNGFGTGGAQRVGALIEDRVKEMPAGPMFYLLENPAGTVVAGNLPRLPARSGTFETIAPRVAVHQDNPKPLRARGAILEGGDYLMVAIGAGERDELRELILRAFAWSSLATLLLAFGGGLLLSGGVLRRVEAISRTAREIMEGEFSRRMPTRGTDDEFDHLSASLNAMLERTESSMRAMRQISNDIAHDLRTPMSRLRQTLERTRRTAGTAGELRAAIDGAIAETDTILETFAALLRIAQIEGGSTRSGFAACDLSELLRTVVEVYQPTADDKHQILVCDVAGSLSCYGDRQLLMQMVANLVDNAIRHSPAGAVIRVGATGCGAGVTVVVSDTGPGIPALERENVFRRFYRLEASRTGPGNGLGLSLVSAIASLHNLSVELADNEPGLRVTLNWPTTLLSSENTADRSNLHAATSKRVLVGNGS